jgi:hypothetical protein
MADSAGVDRTNEQAWWAAINSVDFQNRCRLQWLIAAVSIASESSSTTNNTQRQQLAAQIFSGSIPPVQLAYWVMSSTTVQTEVLTDANANPANPIGYSVEDADIATQVDALFTDFAATMAAATLTTL